MLDYDTIRDGLTNNGKVTVTTVGSMVMPNITNATPELELVTLLLDIPLFDFPREAPQVGLDLCWVPSVPRI